MTRRSAPAARLLDANALIALAIGDHVHHRRVALWLARAECFALCPMVEGALVRYVVRLGGHPATATGFLEAVNSDPRCQFWPDSLTYREAAMGHVEGHRQVTDAYLAALAAQRQGGRLATLDAALAAALPAAVELIPAVA
ncbi:MAG: PIN domain-containing protein [Bifidobacteriaceae bacterium]|jgi:toxin-antitoxin system PIN domain toxin|nr:PIN domain-containing protein [Bifidobacteriaceae bacterium]